MKVVAAEVREDGVESMDAQTRNKLLIENKPLLVAPPIFADCIAQSWYCWFWNRFVVSVWQTKEN